MMKKLFFVIFLIVSINPVSAQDDSLSENSLVDIVYEDAMLYFSNCAAFFLSPLNAGTTDWLYAGGITGANLLLFNQDGQLRKFLGRNTTAPRNGDLWDIPTAYGVVEYSNFLIAGIYGAGLLLDDQKVRSTGRILAETITVSGMTALFLRFATGRERPPYTQDHMAFRWFETTEQFQSFPSGHAVVGVAISTVLAEQIDTWWSRTFFYSLAFLSSYVRLLNNQHWFTDVATGSLLGFGAGMFMLKREEARLNNPGVSRLSISPGINGISFIYSL
jgi:membrane-associated phospholipid phosphatase